MSSSNTKTIKIRNLDVKFPHDAYAIQIKYMETIIDSLNARENAILESPTGTGKSLSLLCSVLAWIYEKKRKFIKTWHYWFDETNNQRASVVKEEKKTQQEDEEYSSKTTEFEVLSLLRDSFLAGDAASEENVVISQIGFQLDSEEKTPKMVENLLKTGLLSFQRQIDRWIEKKFDDSKINSVKDETNPVKKEKKREDIEFGQLTPEIEEILMKLHKKAEEDLTSGVCEVPTVFYCTKMHSQIQSIIKELRKTVYRPYYTILGSREQYCIFKQVHDSPTRNDDCRKSLMGRDKDKCPYYNEAGNLMLHCHEKMKLEKKVFPLIAQPQATEGESQVMDVEDMVKKGKALKACPYYASRDMLQMAEMVFCPYNYVVEEELREILQLKPKLENSIVIFDEAHNIENSARNAASCDIDIAQLESLKVELDHLLSTEAIQFNSTARNIYVGLSCFMDTLMKWISSQNNTPGKASIKCDIDSFLQDMAIEENGAFEALFEFYEKAQQFANSPNDKNEQVLTSNSLSTLSSLFIPLNHLVSHNKKFKSDFRIVLQDKKDENNSFVPGGRPQQASRNYQRRLFSIWCMTGESVFTYLKEHCYSIVLTSGTLSPLNSFSTELGTNFAHKYEGDHIIQSDQVFCARISQFRNERLCGDFKNSKNPGWHQAIGNAILETAKIVPGGILVFFSSYPILNMVFDNLQSTGVLDKIGEIKTIHKETQKRQEYRNPQKNPESFEKELKNYLDSIKNFEKNTKLMTQQKADENLQVSAPSQTSVQSLSVSPPKNEKFKTGAIFFAVYRGKLSEGVDFADNICRAVICCGLAFPQLNDLCVMEKKEHNTQKKNKNKNFISGDEWYSQESGRAINQAIGRCIRHKNDFGAILFMDCRFADSRNVQLLPKWIQPILRDNPNKTGDCDSVLKDLKLFFGNIVNRLPLLPQKANSPSEENDSLNSSEISVENEEDGNEENEGMSFNSNPNNPNSNASSFSSKNSKRVSARKPRTRTKHREIDENGSEAVVQSKGRKKAAPKKKPSISPEKNQPTIQAMFQKKNDQPIASSSAPTNPTTTTTTTTAAVPVKQEPPKQGMEKEKEKQQQQAQEMEMEKEKGNEKVIKTEKELERKEEKEMKKEIENPKLEQENAQEAIEKDEGMTPEIEEEQMENRPREDFRLYSQEIYGTPMDFFPQFKKENEESEHEKEKQEILEREKKEQEQNEKQEDQKTKVKLDKSRFQQSLPPNIFDEKNNQLASKQAPIMQTPSKQAPIMQTPSKQAPIIQTPSKQVPTALIPSKPVPTTPITSKENPTNLAAKKNQMEFTIISDDEDSPVQRKASSIVTPQKMIIPTQTPQKPNSTQQKNQIQIERPKEFTPEEQKNQIDLICGGQQQEENLDNNETTEKHYSDSQQKEIKRIAAEEDLTPEEYAEYELQIKSMDGADEQPQSKEQQIPQNNNENSIISSPSLSLSNSLTPDGINSARKRTFSGYSEANDDLINFDIEKKSRRISKENPMMNPNNFFLGSKFHFSLKEYSELKFKDQDPEDLSNVSDPSNPITASVEKYSNYYCLFCGCDLTHVQLPTATDSNLLNPKLQLLPFISQHVLNEAQLPQNQQKLQQSYVHSFEKASKFNQEKKPKLLEFEAHVVEELRINKPFLKNIVNFTIVGLDPACALTKEQYFSVYRIKKDDVRSILSGSVTSSVNFLEEEKKNLTRFAEKHKKFMELSHDHYCPGCEIQPCMNLFLNQTRLSFLPSNQWINSIITKEVINLGYSYEDNMVYEFLFCDNCEKKRKDKQQPPTPNKNASDDFFAGLENFEEKAKGPDPDDNIATDNNRLVPVGVLVRAAGPNPEDYRGDVWLFPAVVRKRPPQT